MDTCVLTVRGLLWLMLAPPLFIVLLFTSAAIINSWVSYKERHHGG